MSAAVGRGAACGVAERVGDGGGIWESCKSFVGKMNPGPYSEDDVVDTDGESIGTSSLIPEEEPLGIKLGGGGVWRRSSEKVSQNFLPLELRIACCLKLLDKPLSVEGVDEESAIISSSGISPRDSCVGPNVGDERAVAEAWREGAFVGSGPISLSRTWRTTSASLLTSVSMGALSSARAALIRAKPFGFGCFVLVQETQCERMKFKESDIAYQHITSPSHYPSDDTSLSVSTRCNRKIVSVL